MSEPTGVIHDLGYKRYVGTRRPQSTRWRVIARQQMHHAWKGWWRYRLWMILAAITMLVIAGAMVILRSESLGEIGKSGIMRRLVDELVFTAPRFLSVAGFLVALTTGASIVASDLRSGAFTFYFARPVRPVDYVLGKFVGLFLLQVYVLAVPVIVLALVRLGLSESNDELMANLDYVPRAVAIGLAGAAAFAGAGLGFSAVLASPKLNLALWAGHYIVIGSMFFITATESSNQAIGVVDPMYAWLSMSLRMVEATHAFGGLPVAPLGASLVGLAAYLVGGLALAYVRVHRAAHAGIGAS